MNRRRWRTILFSDLGILILLALARIVIHLLTNQQYGFHRDELAILDDARHLAWGYVAYPPLTPFIGRIGLALFGTSTVGVRFLSGLAQGLALVLTGLIARELGGKHWAVIAAGLAVMVAPVSVAQGALFQYVSFDYLWWVLIAFCVARLLNSDNPRWWLGIGAVIGLGMMTKYTMAFFAAGLVGGVLLTPARRYSKSAWLWGGAGLALLIFLPNLAWQAQHGFVSLQQLSAIHAHDVSIGRTDNFILDQFLLGANPLVFPLWLAGLWYFFRKPEGRSYRILGWMYVLPLAIFLLARGRGYYLAPAYPMLLAAGAVTVEGWLQAWRPLWSNLLKGIGWVTLALGAAFIFSVGIPAAPIDSAWFDFASSVNSDLREEIGWPELAASVARVYTNLPEGERSATGIFTNNYGEAGAIDLFGPALGLPEALSGVNSYWLRGYGDPPPKTLIVVGYAREEIAPYFASCEAAGKITIPYDVKNEESKTPDILICRELRQSWAAFWEKIRHFG